MLSLLETLRSACSQLVYVYTEPGWLAEDGEMNPTKPPSRQRIRNSNPKLESWRSEAKHTTYRSRRLPYEVGCQIWSCYNGRSFHIDKTSLIVISVMGSSHLAVLGKIF